MRRREPVSTPGGTLTDSVRVTRTLPSPRQESHGVSTTVPVPRHRAQGWAIWKMPLETTRWPDPRQSGQVEREVPGFAPVPPHAGHAS
jgi:hypothetical protein